MVEMTQEERERFLEYAFSRKALRMRIPVEELEKEFDVKSEAILHCEEWNMKELTVGEFVDVVFQRLWKGSGGYLVPFEEIQSYEYRLWLKQKRQGRQVALEGEALAPVDYSGYRMWRYNPVVFYKDGRKARHRLLLKDDEETMTFLENRHFAIMSPVTYVGRTNSYKNARYLYAFAIDLDGVNISDVNDLLAGMRKGGYPVANIIVSSGHGVHVYYLLDEPVAMYQIRLPLLNRLKAGLTRIVWAVSRLDHPQVQSVVQGFRVPGSLTKFGRPIRAFLNPDAQLYTLDDLNRFLGKYGLSDEELAQLKDKHPHNPARVTRSEARKLWPEWYASRVIGRKRVGKKWQLNRGLYDWWLRKMKDGRDVEVHHRYWCILTLVVYAVKCGVPREEVLADALSLVSSFDVKTKTVDNPFTEDDVYDAMRAYDEEYNKWPIRVIETTTGIRIERNRRNGRDQNVHLKRIRALQDLDYPDGAWRDGNGRKKGSIVSAEASRCAAIVREWQKHHPGCKNKSQCARETGLTRPTVHRWWDDALCTNPDETQKK